MEDIKEEQQRENNDTIIPKTIDPVKHDNIYHAMCGIQKDLRPIGKNQTSANNNANSKFAFNFRGIDDIYNVLFPVLQKHEVFFTTKIDNIARELKTTTGYNGEIKSSYFTLVTVTYTFNHVSGTSITTQCCGEGADNGDKSLPKALSIAYKYAISETFAIAIKELEDPDGSNIGNITPKPQKEIPKPQKEIDYEACFSKTILALSKYGYTMVDLLAGYACSNEEELVKHSKALYELGIEEKNKAEKVK